MHRIHHRDACLQAKWKRRAWQPTWSMHKVHVGLVPDAVDHRPAKEEADVIQRRRGDDEALCALPVDPRVWAQISVWILRG